MPGRSSRQKGSRGELAFRDLLRKFGFQAERTGRGYNAPKDDIAHNIEGVHFEVKAQETWCLPKWLRQAENDAGPHRTPVVAFKKNHGRWYVALPASAFLMLLQEERASLHSEETPTRPTPSSSSE